MTFKGKLEELGENAQKKAIRLSVEGLSAAAIADKLNEEYGSDLTPLNTGDFLRRAKHKMYSYARTHQKNFNSKLRETYFNTLSQINTLTSEIWKVFYDIKENPEYKEKTVSCPKCNHSFKIQFKVHDALLKTADRILELVKHVDKVTGKLKTGGSIKFEQNIVQLTQNIQNVIPKLFHSAEKQGLIKIIKRKRLRESNG